MLAHTYKTKNVANLFPRNILHYYLGS